METELDKIPTYIDGYCKKVFIGPSQQELTYILHSHYKNKITRHTLGLVNIMMEVKMPIIVRLNLGNLKFSVSSKNTYDEFYAPKISDIHSKDLSSNKEIQEHMQNTLESLKMSMMAYEEDNCSGFTSKLIMPLSTYTIGLVYGNIFDWLDFIDNKGAPPIVAQYQQNFIKIIKAEITNLDMYLRAVR